MIHNGEDGWVGAEGGESSEISYYSVEPGGGGVIRRDPLLHHHNHLGRVRSISILNCPEGKSETAGCEREAQRPWPDLRR